MKVVLLAGGRGTRLAEETSLRPKPMVEIGGRPILWHIMHLYAAYGFREFLVASGYKGEMIRESFDTSDDGPRGGAEAAAPGPAKAKAAKPADPREAIAEAFEEPAGGAASAAARPAAVARHRSPDHPWDVRVVDTGLETMTGGRMLRLKRWLQNETFMLTYGDGLSDVDLRALLAFHRGHGRLATITAVHPPARFGALYLDGDSVTAFSEKPQTGEGWINGGFFVFEPAVLDYIGGDATILERDPLERLAADNQLMAYRHTGFWQPMDTLREKEILEGLWTSGAAPWKLWT